MIKVNDLKNGVVIEYDGKLMQIIEFMHVLQNKVAYVRVKMKDLRTGTVTETALKGSDSAFKRAFIDKKTMQYIYADGASYVFMDQETYEQVEIPAERLEWEKNFLKEGMEVQVQFYGTEILNIVLPDKVVVKVSTEPAVAGNTKTNSLKDAFLESGFLVKVPMFIENDEEILVSTLTGEYVSRAK
ncbi:MAG: elongation factor P [Acholeplasmatales bacterium]|nr:elongation factor P [Acholeplasmatales bacterium]